MCSDPGQQMIIDTIKEKHLDGIIVAACSPTLHEKTFQEAARLAGLNPYQIEIANIREQDSWVHTDKEKATKKAIKIVKSACRQGPAEREPGTRSRSTSTGGPWSSAAASAACRPPWTSPTTATRSSSSRRTRRSAGKMIQLSETFPTLDCSQCILTPKMVEVSRHPRIKLLTYHEVESVSGFVGNFKVRIKKKPRYVDETLCNLCGECEKVCPQVVPDEFNMGLSFRKAIYMPFPQAIPGTYTLDAEHCLGLNPVRCGKCKDVCDKKAIDYDMKETIVEEEVGAIVVATGYRPLYDAGPRRVRRREVRGRRQRPRVRAHPVRLGADGGRDPEAVGRQGPQVDRLRPVQRLPRHGKAPALLLEDLLHVHGQARHDVPPPRPGRPSHGLLHRRPDGREVASTSSTSGRSRRTRSSTSAARSPRSSKKATSSSSGASTP